MRISYPDHIEETLEELVAHEQQVRGSKAAVRLRVLVLLKSGQATTMTHAAHLVGYSRSQVVRWWDRYRTGGLAALAQEASYRGRVSRLTPEARADLHAVMQRGEIATVGQARQYLQEHWQIEYRSINGLWWQFRQERTRKKTGRPRHQRTSTARQDAFKKTSPAS